MISVVLNQSEVKILVVLVANLIEDYEYKSNADQLAKMALINLGTRLIIRQNKMTYANRRTTTIKPTESDKYSLLYAAELGLFQSLHGLELNLINKLINPHQYEKKRNKKTTKKFVYKVGI